VLSNDKKITCNPLNKEFDQKTIGLQVAPYGHACHHGCLKQVFRLNAGFKGLFCHADDWKKKKNLIKKRDEPMGGAL